MTVVRSSGWTWLGWWLPVAAVTGLLLALAGPDIAVLSGYPSLGPVAAFAHPFARTLAIGAATAAVGGLLVAVVHAPGEARGALSRPGYAALAVVRCAGPVLAVGGLTVAVLTMSESIGIRPGALLADPPTLVLALTTVESAAGWAIAAVAALLVAALAGVVLTWRGATGLLVVLLAALAVPPATSVASSERSHDWYGDALTLHTVAAVVWLGSTLALAWLLRRGSVETAALRRHHHIAAWATVVLVGSGVVPVVMDAGLDGLGSGYALVAVASAVSLIAALVVLRRRIRAGSAPVLIGAEVALLTVATAAGSALTRLVPPAALEIVEYRDADRLVYLIGYDLPARMGLAELAAWWRIDLLFAPAAVTAAVLYLLAVRRVNRAGGTWPPARTAAWLAGCAAVLVATSSGIGAYATAVFGVHLLAHALLSTIAPLLLVVGHPLTLIRRAAAPGADRIAALADAAPLRVLNRPAVAWGLAAVSVFGMYATGLFDAIVLEHWGHLTMDALALGSGLILFRAVLGAREQEPPAFVRLGLLFVVMMLHAAFAIWLLVQSAPLAERYYAAVALPFVPDLLAAQRFGTVAAWTVSDLAMVAAAVVVARTWAMEDQDQAPASSRTRL